jgi:hypothetical protein
VLVGGIAGTGVGVAAKGLTCGGAGCAEPLVVDELEEGGVLAVFEIDPL